MASMITSERGMAKAIANVACTRRSEVSFFPNHFGSILTARAQPSFQTIAELTQFRTSMCWHTAATGLCKRKSFAILLVVHPPDASFLPSP